MSRPSYPRPAATFTFNPPARGRRPGEPFPSSEEERHDHFRSSASRTVLALSILVGLLAATVAVLVRL